MASELKGAAAGVLAGAIAGAAAGWLAGAWYTDGLDLRARPPIAVADYGAVVRRGHQSEDEIKELMRALDRRVAALGEKGWLVLRADSVVAAPSGLRVPVPEAAPAEDAR